MTDELYEQQNIAYTENGGRAYRSTGSACLDFFAAVGALRGDGISRIEQLFMRAFAENPDRAIQTAFFARDIRGGLGERKVFRTVMRFLAGVSPESVTKNLPLFSEYGRYDDLMSLFGTPCEAQVCAFIGKLLEADEKSMGMKEEITLLAKWLPSVNASNSEKRIQAKKLCKYLGVSESEYRKRLSALRSYSGVLEKCLCTGDYSFAYENQPSAAMFKYRRAFYRNDGQRYSEYLYAVKNGKKQLHASTLYPYEIIRETLKDGMSSKGRETLDLTWKALPAVANPHNAIAVIDGSGSMYVNSELPPVTVAVSLGIYFAEHNTGCFHNKFITFSQTPQLVSLKGCDIYCRARYCMSYNEVAKTDLYEVFMLLLMTAVKNKLPQSELPERLYIISDMEFNSGCTRDKTVFEDAREKFEDYGYRLPEVVYWNVESRGAHYPAIRNTKGVALVSGASPLLFGLAMEQKTTPEDFMNEVLGAERYCGIRA